MYINPALDVTAAPGKKIRRWDVFYANDDWTVLAARFIPSVLWGAMGRYGYKGDDNRYMGHELHQFMDFKGSLGHSGALKYASLFGPRLAGMIGEAPSQEPNPTIN
jgi:hypothetical protein